MFFVGQRVVFVGGSKIDPKFGSPNPTQLTHNETYTIREIDTRAEHIHGCAAVRLRGITLPASMTCIGLWERAFPLTDFRPVVERKTSIEVFKQILRDVTARESERA